MSIPTALFTICTLVILLVLLVVNRKTKGKQKDEDYYITGEDE